VRARLIANPTAGADRAAPLLPVINERLRELVPDLDITVTTGEDDVLRAATRAAAERCELLFVAGGDGTLNAAVRAVALAPGGLDCITFGVIPAGTGNDFAKALGLGEDPEAALEVLVQGRVVNVDLGVLNGRTFFNTSAGGFIADVSASLTEELKDAAGKLAYIIGGARALAGRDPFRTTLRIEGRQPGPPLDLTMFAVCNARFIGGGYPIAPDAIIDDGLLDVFLVKGVPLLEFVGLLQKVAAGEHPHDERVMHFRAGELDLEFDRTVNVNTDGEVLEARRCEYRVRHRAARFLCGETTQAGASPRPLDVGSGGTRP
jgi:diacylglycerol kinase (ATP)